MSNANPLHTLGNNNLNPIYEETNHVTRDLHESESHQKDTMIKTLTERLDTLANRMKHVKGSKRLGGLSCDDLCMHRDVELSEGYKLPKFEMFNGIGNPKDHLRMYCDKIVGVGEIRRYSSSCL